MPNMAQFTLMRHERKGYAARKGEKPTPEDVGDFIRRRLGANKAEVAFAFGIPDSTAYRLLCQARNRGLVETVGRGRAVQWMPTE